MIPKKLFVVFLARIITVVLLVSAVQAADLSVESVDAAVNDAKAGRILYLNSYNRGYSWSDDIERGLVERLKNADREIELSVEYLDSRRFLGTGRNDLLAAILAAKYTGYQHDIVVVSDNFAFDFATKYRKKLFPDLPIVFCGYNNFSPDVLKGISNITGINEEVDFAKTVELAIRIQPVVRNLVFIISTGDASNRRMAEVAENTLFPELRKGYNLIVLKDASMAEIGSRLGALLPDSAVFLIGMTSDLIKGRRPTAVENTRMIVATSPVPVYSFWDFALGTGILGGHIITGLDQGRTAADMVLRILDGTSADSIPVLMQTPARNSIDFNVMRKYGIKVNDLPEGCAFINRSVPLWESYGWYIGAALLAISLEALLIVALVVSLRQRKEAFRMLGIERDLLEQRVEERTGELQRANELLEEEINVRNRTERVITARLRLLEFAATHSLDELLETTIDEAEALTGSSIGFYHFLEADQKTLSLQSWSTRTKAEFCKAEGKGLHYNVSQAGVWIDCIRQRKPVIHNDYASLPHRKGMPPDHAQVIRELVQPVFRGDSIVAIIGVGNKPHDYTAEDIEAVSFLADLAWEIAERKQAEEALQQAHDELEHRVTIRTKELLRANEALRSEIADRKRAEDALQKSEEKYRLVANNSNDWIYLVDSDGKFQYVSPSSKRMTGYPAVEFMNNPQLFQKIVHPDDKELVKTHHETAENGTKTSYLEYRIINKQGELRWVMHSCAPVYNDQGEYIGRSGTNRDFTERKHAEDTLRLLSSRLLTSQEEEQRRIAMELHDQTGQDILFLKLQLQALRKQLRKDQKKLIKDCDKILTFTDKIIEDIRSIAHGLSPSQLETLGLYAALKKLIQNFSEKTLIPLRFNVEALDNGLDPQTQIVLYRIFQEALTNIYKHARAQTVWIDVRRQGNHLSISIRDDGQGFDTCRHRTSGPAVERGMGLSALELRSRMIGADLRISSQPGQGTEIILFVPIKGNTVT